MRIIVSNSAGSSPDIITRLVADRLGSTLGQSFIVDNRPGGEGVIGAELAKRATPVRFTSDYQVYKFHPVDAAR